MNEFDDILAVFYDEGVDEAARAVDVAPFRALDELLEAIALGEHLVIRRLIQYLKNITQERKENKRVKV